MPLPARFLILAGVVALAAVASASPAVATWQPAGGKLNAAGAPDLARPALADVGGHADAAWVEETGDDASVHAAAWTGAGWSTLGTSVSGAEHVYDRDSPAIAAVGSTPYVAWTADPNQDGSSLLVHVSSWNGTAWATVGGGPLNVDSTRRAYEPTLANVGGVLYAAWTEDDSGNDTDKLHVAKLVGGSWQLVGAQPAQLNASFGGYQPSIADVGGVPWVAYREFEFCCPPGGQELMQIRVEKLAADAWTSVGTGSITSANTQGESAALAVVKGTPTLAWEEDYTAPEVDDVRVAQWNGSAWVRLGGTLNGATRARSLDPVSLTAINGQPWVGLDQQNDGNDAQVDRWTGSAWEVVDGPLQTTTADNYTSLPDVVSIAGEGWVAWLDTLGESGPVGEIHVASQPRDTTPPVPSARIGGVGQRASGDTYAGYVTVVGSATDPAPSSGTPTVRCVLDPPTPPASFDAMPSQPCTQLTTAPGQHTFSVAARDPAGNTSAVVSVSFTLVGEPDTVIIEGTFGNTWQTVAHYSFFSTIPGSTFVCSFDGAPATPCTSPAYGGPFAAGTSHTFAVQAVAPGGAIDRTPATAAFHVNATHSSTESCEVNPITAATLGSLSGKRACDGWFGYPGPQYCGPLGVCFFYPQDGCPASATCTLSTTTTVTDAEPSDDWRTDVGAELRPLSAAWLDIYHQYGHCELLNAITCRIHQTAGMIGPGWGEGYCGAVGPYDRSDTGPTDLRCDWVFTVAPTTPLFSLPVAGGISLFAPAAGGIVFAPPGGARRAVATAAKAKPKPKKPAKPAPVFKTVTKKVAAAGAITFVPTLSAAAKASLKKHRKLVVSVRATFTPASGGPPITRTIRVTLTVAAKRLPTCPAHLPKHPTRKAVDCIPRRPH